MRRLGITPGAPVIRERLSQNAWTALDRAIPFAQRKIRDHATRAVRIMNGWAMMTSPIGTYGTDYLKRALVAFMGLGASPVEDALFPTAFTMPDGSPFDSNAKYEVRLPANGLPPARAFWSLTMYNDQQLFADNPIRRYAIGNRDYLRYDSDGSLMLYIQRESPGRDRESNWLPTPRQGAFTMTLPPVLARAEGAGRNVGAAVGEARGRSSPLSALVISFFSRVHRTRSRPARSSRSCS
jgi:hypothetical protein